MTFGDLEVDFTDEFEGEPVILVHSSGSSNRQWRSLTELLSQRYRVLAINLFGYGSTTPWPGREPQTLADQADLLVALAERVGRPRSVGRPLVRRRCGPEGGNAAGSPQRRSSSARPESLLCACPTR